MTLDDAIRHAIEVAEKNEAFVKCHSDDIELGVSRKCAEDHRQLAEWLEELKERRNNLQDRKRIDLKPCPFCGKKVELTKEPLWNGSHGYYGSYEYVIKCENPRCQCQIYLGKNDTIYRDDEEAQRNAVEAWNRRA